MMNYIKGSVKNIRGSASPLHVPIKIIEVPDLPYTLNMNKVELAVQKMIHGREVKNKDALKNPEGLDFFADIKDVELLINWRSHEDISSIEF